MTTFILSQEPIIEREGKEPESGRVILDDKTHGPVIDSIEAEAVKNAKGEVIKSAWRIAREKIDESKFYRVDGFGWLALEACA